MGLLARACTLLLVPFIAILCLEVYGMTIQLFLRDHPAHPTHTMRATVYHGHGPSQDVLHVEDFARPDEAAPPGTIVIKVAAAALNPVDFKMCRNEQPSALIPKPKIPGTDVSGTVVSAGEGSGFAVGDKVFGMLPIVGKQWGALSEYTAGDASVFAHAPKNIPLEDAAALPLVGLTVLQVMDKAGLVEGSAATGAGKSILIQAGAGGVGTFALQYARNVLGFGKVATTCSPGNNELVTSLGATQIVDYRTTEFEREVQGFDVVLDPMAWAYRSRTLDNNVLHSKGKYCYIMGSDWDSNSAEASIKCVLEGPVLAWSTYFASLAHTLTGGVIPATPRVYASAVIPDGRGLARIAAWVEAGKLHAVVDKKFRGLERSRAAFAHLESGHAKGKVLILP